MRSEVKQDWTWADSHLPAIVDVLKQNAMHLLSIKVASEDADLKQATDLVITVKGGDIAVRVRRPQYNSKYRDLTIRAWRKGGIKTEIDKLKAGFARWYLYGWSDGNGGLADWILVDLDKLRESGLLDNPKIKKNRDGTTGFVAFHVTVLRLNNCLVANA